MASVFSGLTRTEELLLKFAFTFLSKITGLTFVVTPLILIQLFKAEERPGKGGEALSKLDWPDR